MSENVDLTTRKFLKTDAETEREAADVAVAAAQSVPAAQSAWSFNMSHIVVGALVFVAVGLLYRHRSSIGLLNEPVGHERASNAVLWAIDADYRYEDTKLGQLTGDHQRVELPEAAPLPTVDFNSGFGGREREQDHWFEALPGE